MEPKPQYRRRETGVQRVTVAAAVLPEVKAKIDQLAAKNGQRSSAYLADLIGKHVRMPV